MSLRRQVVTSWAILVVVFGILVVLASSFFLVRNLHTLEENHSREDLRRIRNAVAAEVANLDSTTREFASRDETYAFMTNPTPAYFKSDLSYSTLRTISVNVLMLINNNGTIVAIKTLNAGDRRSTPASDLLRFRSLAKGLVGPISTDTAITGITRTGQRTFLFAARPILTSNHHGPSRGTLIMAREFDDQSARRLSGLLNLNIAIANPGVSTSGSTFLDDVAIEHHGSSTITGTVVLRGAESEPALVLRTEIPVVIETQARRAQWYLVVILLAITTLLGFAKLAWLERRVLLPIADLSTTIKQVTDLDDLTKRAPLRAGGGRNELAMLIVRINLMLDRLQRSRAELMQARSSLEHQAAHDGLTGALNKSTISLLFEQELARARRDSRPVAAMMIDVDRFKSVNDTYGHDVGDEVLNSAVREIRKVLRPYDLLGRYGGDEFLVIAPNADNDCAMMIAERIRKQICQVPIAARHHLLQVTVSIGVASGIGFDPPTLMRAADEALYVSKNAGRNTTSLAPLQHPQPRLIALQGAN